MPENSDTVSINNAPNSKNVMHSPAIMTAYAGWRVSRLKWQKIFGRGTSQWTLMSFCWFVDLVGGLIGRSVIPRQGSGEAKVPSLLADGALDRDHLWRVILHIIHKYDIMILKIISIIKNTRQLTIIVEFLPFQQDVRTMLYFVNIVCSLLSGQVP